MDGNVASSNSWFCSAERLSNAERRLYDKAMLHQALISDLVAGIGSDPEVGYQEYRAAERISRQLESEGHRVQRGIADMPTALMAVAGSGDPVVALLAEYDALPDLGHGCGHNVIAGAAVLAFLCLAAEIDRGSVMLLGCPAEESAVDGAGGKIRLLDNGYFDNVDASLMVHPYDRYIVPDGGSLAARGMEFSFVGRAAHAAAAPEQGLNALDAAVQMYVSVGLLRQQLPSEVRLHGTFTDGGGSPNVIPATAKLRFRVRAPRATDLQSICERVSACARGAAQSSGCEVAISDFQPLYAELQQDPRLATNAASAMLDLGLPVIPSKPTDQFGSTDFGNVSQMLPSVELGIGLASPGTPLHSAAFTQSATSVEAGRHAVAGGLAMAITAARSLSLLDS